MYALVAGSLVIITDPWWAPAIEEQAEDRCYRLGHQNPIKVVRLVAQFASYHDEVSPDVYHRRSKILENYHLTKALSWNAYAPCSKHKKAILQVPRVIVTEDDVAKVNVPAKVTETIFHNHESLEQFELVKQCKRSNSPR